MFDFDKLNIKPSQILRKVSYKIHKSITKDQVNDIKHRFVSEDIFSQVETEECTDCSSLLAILRRRDEEQIGNALNIICEDSTNKQVIKAIEEELSKQKIKVTQSVAFTVNQTSSSSTANQVKQLEIAEPKIKIANPSSVTDTQSVSNIQASSNTTKMGELVNTVRNVKRIVTELKKDSYLLQNWTRLAYSLDIQRHVITGLTQKLSDEKIAFEVLLADILNAWASSLSSEETTVEAFCKILKEENFISAKERIEKEFSTQLNLPKAFNDNIKSESTTMGTPSIGSMGTLVKDKLQEIVKLLVEDGTIHTNWKKLAHGTELPYSKVQTLTQKYNNSTFTLDEVLEDVLMTWCGKSGPNATITALCAILEKQEMRMCDHMIKTKFSAI